jgi:hypothetical protein
MKNKTELIAPFCFLHFVLIIYFIKYMIIKKYF